ncbi:MAG TPA: acyltransferase [Candidatus Omnitrophota bacterium]|nr:acyltransferase [Candidatus Omnitrophota bacterium]
MDHPKRFIQLDVLRAIAVLLVFGRHLPSLPVSVDGFTRWIVGRLHMSGWIGVDLFFVISGFLVSGLIFREYMRFGQFDFVRFLVRRGLKIYPGFYVLVTVTLIVSPFLTDTRPSGRQILGELFYIQNYIGSLWGHTWSLAVEEHFYLLLGLLVLVYTKTNKTNALLPLVQLYFILAVFVLGLRVITSLYVPRFFVWFHLYPTHLRIDALFFGVLLSYLHHFHYQRFKELILKYRYGLLLLSVICILPMLIKSISTSRFLQSFGLTMLYVGFGGLMILSLYCLNENTLRRYKIVEILGNIGYYSYSIYLWHMVVLIWGLPLLRGLVQKSIPYLLELTFFIAGSLVVGIGMAKLVEMPILKIRDRIFTSRSGVLIQ